MRHSSRLAPRDESERSPATLWKFSSRALDAASTRCVKPFPPRGHYVPNAPRPSTRTADLHPTSAPGAECGPVQRSHLNRTLIYACSDRHCGEGPSNPLSSSGRGR
jgi:hypothetical protein